MCWLLTFVTHVPPRLVAALEAKVGFAVGGNAALGKTADGGEAWTWRSDLSDTRGNRLLGVHFVDERYGWVVGSSSRIYRTTDGGASWEVETWEVGRTFRGVHFADRRAGIVVGDDGFVIWSADGGKTWALRVVSTKASMRAAHCVNSTHGFVAGYLGSLFRTRDAGQSWQEPRNIPLRAPFHRGWVQWRRPRVGSGLCHCRRRLVV